MRDGTILSKDSTPESGTVAAVVVRAAENGTPALGVGIVHNRIGLAWCTTKASGHRTNITALQGTIKDDYIDGSNSWELLVKACDDLKNATEITIETVAQNYPVFNFCRKYGVSNKLTGELAEGWYLPTLAELYTIYKNKTTIDTSLSKAGGNEFDTDLYWSCCQYPSQNNGAHIFNFRIGSSNWAQKENDQDAVCAVKTFN